MQHMYDHNLLIATQRQAAKWAAEAREMREYMETTPTTSPTLLAYRRMRCIVAQKNAATYHEWVAHDLNR